MDEAYLEPSTVSNHFPFALICFLLYTNIGVFSPAVLERKSDIYRLINCSHGNCSTPTARCKNQLIFFSVSFYFFTKNKSTTKKKKSTTPSDNCKHLMTYQTLSTTNCSDFVASNFKMSSQGETVLINIPWIEKKKRKEKKSDYISTSSTSDST